MKPLTAPAAAPTLTPACAYLRASSEKQRNSVPVQHGIILEGAKRFGLQLPDISTDYVYETPDPANPYYTREHRHTITGCFFDAGVSAEKVRFLERPAAQQMLGYMLAKDIKRILVAKLDRTFRNVSDCLDTIEELTKRGIYFIIMDCGDGQILDTSDASAELRVTMLAAVARFENARKSQRVKETAKFLKSENKPIGKAPYGWRVTGRREVMQPVPAEQEILRRLMSGDLSKLTLREAQRRLNAEGVPTKRGGAKWHASTVQSVREHARLYETKTSAN